MFWSGAVTELNKRDLHIVCWSIHFSSGFIFAFIWAVQVFMGYIFIYLRIYLLEWFIFYHFSFLWLRFWWYILLCSVQLSSSRSWTLFNLSLWFNGHRTVSMSTFKLYLSTVFVGVYSFTIHHCIHTKSSCKSEWITCYTANFFLLQTFLRWRLRNSGLPAVTAKPSVKATGLVELSGSMCDKCDKVTICVWVL